MRIIAGIARGRKIFSVSKKLPVKPISDRIKQSVFDILRPCLPGAFMLDLFCGTGNVSLEAISRGVQKVVMVDWELACIKNVKRNLVHLGFTDKAVVLKGDLLKPLKWISAYMPPEGFDIIFMGPPYRDINNNPLSFTEPVLQQISLCKLLSKQGLIVAQHHKQETFSLPEDFEIFREEKYGDTVVHFLRYKNV